MVSRGLICADGIEAGVHTIAGGRLRSRLLSLARPSESNQREGRPRFDGEEMPAEAGLRLHSPVLLAKTGGCGTHLPFPSQGHGRGRFLLHFKPDILVRQSSNSPERNAFRTQRRGDAPSALERVRVAAKQHRQQRFTALLHHVYDCERLRAAYLGLKREATPGVDGESWQHYAENLEANLQELSARLKRGAYRAQARSSSLHRQSRLAGNARSGCRRWRTRSCNVP